jgi:cold shock CspA family protein
MGVLQRGKVERFDKDVGLGEVRAADARLYQFHCTEIADGSRHIAVGAEVTFVVAPGHRGTWEARQLEAGQLEAGQLEAGRLEAGT